MQFDKLHRGPALGPRLEARKAEVLAKLAGATGPARAVAESEARALAAEIGVVALIKIAQTNPISIFSVGMQK